VSGWPRRPERDLGRVGAQEQAGEEPRITGLAVPRGEGSGIERIGETDRFPLNQGRGEIGPADG
jgi:hypothetical protein